MKVDTIIDYLGSAMMLIGWAGLMSTAAGMPVSTAWEARWLPLLALLSTVLMIGGMIVAFGLFLILPHRFLMWEIKRPKISVEW